MKEKIAILVVIIILVLLVIIAAKICIDRKNQYPKSDFIIDNGNKYIITTSMKWATMQNDGGSHTNTYYRIDFKENKVVKCQDKYVGFEGYEYQGKILYEKQLEEVESVELRTIIDNAIANPDEEEMLNFNFYIISSSGNEDVKIYNKDIIHRIQQLLEN